MLFSGYWDVLTCHWLLGNGSSTALPCASWWARSLLWATLPLAHSGRILPLGNKIYCYGHTRRKVSMYSRYLIDAIKPSVWLWIILINMCLEAKNISVLLHPPDSMLNKYSLACTGWGFEDFLRTSWCGTKHECRPTCKGGNSNLGKNSTGAQSTHPLVPAHIWHGIPKEVHGT